MEELRAYGQLLILRRQRLVALAAQEHRPHTEDEIAEMGRLWTAIQAILATVSEISPTPQAPPRPPAELSAQPDPEVMTDEEYRVVAAAAYATRREYQRVSIQNNSEYGKWLITTIALVNFGGIYLLATSTTLDVATKTPGIWALVIGTVLIFLSGFAAWSNWGHNAVLFEQVADARMLVDRNAWPSADPGRLAWLKFTYWASIVLGVAALLCMPIAAALVL